MSDIAIRVDGLGKRYRIALPQERHNTLRDALADQARRTVRRIATLGRAPARSDGRPDHIWALRDVSFEVERGSVVGIIGPNGAGKSTLLKILSRITEPTEGEVRIRGRVGSLLEVGTGFHSELTGRENLYLSGAILGMRRHEIDRKFDEIVAFAGVEPFIDTPVKHYSSGMYLRLAFAVAAHLEPDILVVDEVLAVGDAAFQKKCLGRMRTVAHEGRTVLFVSHNMAAISTLCSRGILLRDGRIAFDGGVDEAITAYNLYGAEASGAEWLRSAEWPARPLQFNRIAASFSEEQPDLALDLEVVLESTERHKPAFVAVDILHGSGTPLMQALPRLDGFISSEHRHHRVRLRVALPPLVPGQYLASLWVGSHHTETLEQVDAAVGFEVFDSPTRGRTYPHSTNHGYVVPPSTVEYQPLRTAPEALPGSLPAETSHA